jgi:putative membrane protein
MAAEISEAVLQSMERTWMAHERTLMAWVRTATSMISFGFTVYKFFQYEQEGHGGGHARGIFTPRDFAIFLVSIGLVALVLATITYQRDIKELTKNFSTPHHSLAVPVAALVALFGIVVLIATILHG